MCLKLACKPKHMEDIYGNRVHAKYYDYKCNGNCDNNIKPFIKAALKIIETRESYTHHLQWLIADQVAHEVYEDYHIDMILTGLNQHIEEVVSGLDLI